MKQEHCSDIDGNKAKRQISKLGLQENKARQIFRKTNIYLRVNIGRFT